MEDDGEPEQDEHVDGVCAPGMVEVECLCLRSPDVMRTLERKRTFGTGRGWSCVADSGSTELPVVSGSEGESCDEEAVLRLACALLLLATMMMGGGVREVMVCGSSSISCNAFPGTIHGFGEERSISRVCAYRSRAASGMSWRCSSNVSAIFVRMSSVDCGKGVPAVIVGKSLESLAVLWV